MVFIFFFERKLQGTGGKGKHINTSLRKMGWKWRREEHISKTQLNVEINTRGVNKRNR
jgi:hypothetical protein